jgi:hypothetical protein
MEQCQEIMTLGNLPYTPAQVIVNILHLLMASTIFPNQEFETWDAMMVKMYPALKMFIHEAYTQRLNVINCATHCQPKVMPQLRTCTTC